MKFKTMPFIVGVVLLLSGVVSTQTSAQSNTEVSSDTSVQASKDNVHVSSTASSSSSVTGPSKDSNAELAAGTAFNAALVTPIDSRKAKPGDQISARITENVKGDGRTFLPKGTKLAGHITQASARANGDSESSLGVAFDHAVLKNGEVIPLRLTIQALAAAQTPASAASQDIDAMSNTNAGIASSARNRGVLGGATSSAGGAVGTTTSMVGGTETSLNSRLDSARGMAGTSQAVGGLTASGQMAATSRGVFNLRGLSLNSELSNEAQGSLVTSSGKTVRLDSGTHMLLVTQAASAASR